MAARAVFANASTAAASPATTTLYVARLPGWIAQWREMIEDPTTKIGRPRQVYVGAGKRDYVPVADR